MERVLFLPVDFGDLRLRRETAPIRTVLLVNPNVGKGFLALLLNFRTGLGSLRGLSAAVDALYLILNFLCRRKVYLQNLGSKFIIRGVLLLLLRFLKLPS